MIIFRFLVPLIVFGLCVWGNIALAQWLFTKLIDVSWVSWAKAGIVFIELCATVGLTIVLTILSLSIIMVATDKQINNRICSEHEKYGGV